MPFARRAALGLLLAVIATPARAEGPPPFPREFRAVWVATVGNIDWPSKPGLSTAEQQREAVAILDLAARTGLNAVVFQVRPSADAFYASKLEPWSAFLTGTQGRAPEPFYDPLAFWVEQAHARGLQLHAWFNPFRARYQGARYDDSAGHVSRARPGLVRRYGGMLWMDPGEVEAREHTLAVILDVVGRYDVDGVHFDDYFYPYPVADPAAKGKELDFPDDAPWSAYQSSGGKLARDDWRRSNINDLVRRLYDGIHAKKPGVQFGISPFGIPRPGQPAGVRGFDQYAKLYADAVLWLNRGWCDYFAPQLYWKVDAPGQPFRPLLKEWLAQNTQTRHVWPGLSISRVGSGRNSYDPEEILRQVAILRETPGADGHILFSMKALSQDRRGLVGRFREGPYHDAALVPASPWLDREAPPAPVVTVKDAGAGRLALELKAGPGEAPFVWAVSARRGGVWTHAVYPAGRARVEVEGDAAAVSAVDRLGNASAPLTVPGR